jgi:predicted transcriptional regulator
MSRVLSIRLKDDQVERLGRVAGRLGRTRSEAAAALLEEALRREQFALIEFRGTPAGRQAFLQGTRVKAWQVAWLSPAFDGDAERIAVHLGLPVILVQAGLEYAKAYPDEIAAAIANQDHSIDELRRLMPNLQVFAGDAPAS